MLVLAQLFNTINARSETTSAFRHFFANKWLWAAIALSALLQVAVVQLGQRHAAIGSGMTGDPLPRVCRPDPKAARPT